MDDHGELGATSGVRETATSTSCSQDGKCVFWSHPPTSPTQQTNRKGETPGGTRAHYHINAGYVTGVDKTARAAEAPHRDTYNLCEHTPDNIKRS